MRSVMLLALITLAGTLTPAEELQDFAGTWVVQLGDRNIIVMTLTKDGNEIRGTFERPAKYSGMNGAFGNISGPIRRDKVIQKHFADGMLHLIVQNGDDPKSKDGFAMTVKGDRAELRSDELPTGVVLQPLSFARVPAPAKVAIRLAA